MARRGEYIRKRVDERWEGRYKYCLTIDGKWKYRSVYGKTYTEVKEKLNAAKFKHEYCNTTKMKSNSFSNVLLYRYGVIQLCKLLSFFAVHKDFGISLFKH